jgi:electron-transferring-flavoprotein dehydrogenase
MSERESMQYDVVIVGAGPAGLAFAIRLKQLKPELSVCVIEKASTVGAHILSGAVIETGPLDASCCRPGARIRRRSACPPPRTSSGCSARTGGRKLPVPPGMNNHGNVIVSLGAMCAWLAPQAEALGVEIYPGFAAAEPLHRPRMAKSAACASATWAWPRMVRTSRATPKASTSAPVTVLAEGARGHLTKR